MSRTLKVLSALLTYPTAELQQAAGEISEALEAERLLPAACARADCISLLNEIATGDLYDLQERYVLLFDRTRSLSLHLFEHVHGESRDRGQAMVDLKALYERHGLLHERGGAAGFPAAVPGVSLDAAARRSLRVCSARPAHILAAMAERLRKRRSAYEAVFRALLALAAAKPKDDEVAALLQQPDPDASDLAALDAAWEDEPVSFGPDAANGCKDGLIARLRGALRPAPDMPAATRNAPPRA